MSVWDVDLEIDTVVSLTGERAVRALTSSAGLESDRIPVPAQIDVPFAIQLTWQQPVLGSGLLTRPKLTANFYDASDTLVGAGVHAPVEPVRITLFAVAAGTATVTTLAAHGWTTGDLVDVIVESGSPGGVSDFYALRVPITVTGASTFTYATTATVGGVPGVLAQAQRRPREYLTSFATAAGVWQFARQVWIEPPADAVFVRLRWEIDTTSFEPIVVDSLNIYRTARACKMASLTTVGAIPGSPPTLYIPFDDANRREATAPGGSLYNYGQMMSRADNGVLIPEDGDYIFTVRLSLQRDSGPTAFDASVALLLVDAGVTSFATRFARLIEDPTLLGADVEFSTRLCLAQGDIISVVLDRASLNAGGPIKFANEGTTTAPLKTQMLVRQVLNE